MQIGYNLFKCDECKKIFIGPHYEYAASILASPLKCPICSSYHTYPLIQFYNKFIYKKIWEETDKDNKHQSL